MCAGTPISWMMSVTMASRLGSLYGAATGMRAAWGRFAAVSCRIFESTEAASQGFGMK